MMAKQWNVAMIAMIVTLMAAVHFQTMVTNVAMIAMTVTLMAVVHFQTMVTNSFLIVIC
jgi:hypothetical protein